MDIQNSLDLINTISNNNGLDNFVSSVRNEIDGLEVNIAILGEFSSGKSTLVNSFLGKEILPAMPQPTTAAIVEISGSDELTAFKVKNGNYTEIELSDLGEYIMGDKHKSVDKIVINAPQNEFIHKGIRIIDTPGISSINEVHDGITFGYLPFIDGCLIVMDINQGNANASLDKFIKDKVLNYIESHNLFFVLNYADTMSTDKVREVKELLTKHLSTYIKNPIVIAISAKDALNGNIEKSNIEELKNLVIKNIISKKQEYIEQRTEKLIKEKAKQLSHILSEKLKSLKIDTQETDVMINQVKSEIEEIESEMNQLKEAFNQVRNNLQGYVKSLSDRYAPILLNKVMQDKPEELKRQSQKVTTELQNYINSQISVLKSSIHVSTEGISDELEISIRQASDAVKSTIDSISPIITGLILASVTGPVGVLASEVVVETAIIGAGKAMSRNPGVMSTFLSGLMKTIDVPGKIMKSGAEWYMREDVKSQIYEALSNSISGFIDMIEINVNQTMKEDFIEPQKALEKALTDARKQKQGTIESVSKLKTSISNDIEKLAAAI